MYEGKHIHFSEVDNKPLCSYSPKLCKQRRLNGYAFCIRHVLEDKTAPFKQCEYVAKYNSQRCTNPIPKAEDRRWVVVLFCKTLDWRFIILQTQIFRYAQVIMVPSQDSKYALYCSFTA